MEDKQEYIEFEKTFYKIVENSFKYNKYAEANKVVDWVKTIMVSNVPNGKRNRGLSVVTTFRLLNQQNITNDFEADVELSRILGWCVEMLQTFLLIIDDIMDGGVQRRGQLCWHLRKDVGLNACNDSILLNEEIYAIMKLHFQNKPNYGNFLDIFHEITRLTCYGQCLESIFNPPNAKPKLDTFSPETYASIVKFKTSYYSFVLPVRLAMYLSNWNNPEDHDLVENILFKIGHLYQLQDDFLDYFGDSEVVGKICGRIDIEDGKCCWPIVTALTICDRNQLRTLEECYGIKDADCVKRVIDIYNDLEIVNIYRKEEESHYNKICELIDDMYTKTTINMQIFHEILNKIYRRVK